MTWGKVFVAGIAGAILALVVMFMASSNADSAITDIWIGLAGKNGENIVGIVPFADYFYRYNFQWDGFAVLILMSYGFAIGITIYALIKIAGQDAGKLTLIPGWLWIGLLILVFVGLVALGPDGLRGLFRLIGHYRANSLETLNGLGNGTVAPETVDAKEWFTDNWLTIIAIVAGIVFLPLILFTKGGRTIVGDLLKNNELMQAIVIIAILGAGIWWFLENTEEPVVSSARAAVTAPAPAQRTAIVTPAPAPKPRPITSYRRNVPLSGPYLAAADYTTAEVGAWPSYRVSRKWGAGITNWTNTCIDWYNSDLEIGSRVGFSGPFHKGLVPDYNQVTFRSKSGMTFATQIDRKPAGTC